MLLVMLACALHFCTDRLRNVYVCRDDDHISFAAGSLPFAKTMLLYINLCSTFIYLFSFVKGRGKYRLGGKGGRCYLFIRSGLLGTARASSADGLLLAAVRTRRPSLIGIFFLPVLPCLPCQVNVVPRPLVACHLAGGAKGEGEKSRSRGLTWILFL